MPNRGTFITDNTGTVTHVQAEAGPRFAWNIELNRPMANVTYQVTRPGSVATTWTFHTDQLARVDHVHVDGVQHMPKPLDTAIRSTYQQSKVGRIGGKGFEGAHASASVVGGPGERINLFPAHWTVNRGPNARSMTTMERRVSSWLDTHPGSYDMQMNIKYGQHGQVPVAVDVTAFRNGGYVQDWFFRPGKALS